MIVYYNKKFHTNFSGVNFFHVKNLAMDMKVGE